MRIVAFICVVFTYLSLSIASAQQVIRVVLTSNQAPFVIDPATREGLAFDVLNILNESQTSFQFEESLIPVKRLFYANNYKQYDLVLFNDVNWGWAELGAKGSTALTNGRDVFISLESANMDPLVGSIAAVRGYHYRFANYNPDHLSKMQRVTLVNSEADILKMVLSKRTQWGVISESYLNWFGIRSAHERKRLRVLPKEDHRYQRQFVVFKHSKISVEQINALLASPMIEAKLKNAFRNYGLIGPIY